MVHCLWRHNRKQTHYKIGVTVIFMSDKWTMLKILVMTMVSLIHDLFECSFWQFLIAPLDSNNLIILNNSLTDAFFVTQVSCGTYHQQTHWSQRWSKRPSQFWQKPLWFRTHAGLRPASVTMVTQRCSTAPPAVCGKSIIQYSTALIFQQALSYCNTCSMVMQDWESVWEQTLVFHSSLTHP